MRRAQLDEDGDNWEMVPWGRAGQQLRLQAEWWRRECTKEAIWRDVQMSGRDRADEAMSVHTSTVYSRVVVGLAANTRPRENQSTVALTARGVPRVTATLTTVWDDTSGCTQRDTSP